MPPVPEDFVRLHRHKWHALLPAGTVEVFLGGQSPSGVRKLGPREEELLRKLMLHGPRLFGEGYGQLLVLLEPSTVKTEVKRDPDEGLSLETCRAIERSLLEPWPAAEPVHGERMHWGAVLHNLVRMAATAYGAEWPRHTAILCTSAADTMDLLQLQTSASVLVAVVCSSEHWAVALAKRGHSDVVILDGLKEAGVRQEAEAFLEHLAERWEGPFRLVDGACMPQKDSWSCGQRVLLSVRAFYERCQQEEAWPPHIPVWTCSDTALKKLCKLELGPVKQEAKMPVQAAKQPERASGEEKEPSTPQRKSSKAEPPQGDADDEDEAPLLKEPAPKRSKTQVAEAAGDGDDAAIVKEPVHKRPRMTEAKKKQLWREQGLEMCRSKGIDYNQGFQKIHVEMKAALPVNHWQDFLVDLGKNTGHLKCHACRVLRLRMLDQESLVPAAADEEVEGSGQAIVEAEPKVHKGRGRPPKGTRAATLIDWLHETRPGVYRQLRGSLFYCYVCQRECNFHRVTLSAQTKVFEHEGTKHHKRQLSQQEGGSLSVVHKASPCPGVPIGSGKSSLDALQESCEAWLGSGMLNCLVKDGQKPEPLQLCNLAYVNDQLVLKHKDCTGTFVEGGACALCGKLAENKQLHQQIARWGMRLCLVQHARSLATGTQEEREETKAALLAGDYCKFSSLQKELDEVLNVEQEEARLILIKRKMDSINRASRTERLQLWIRECVVQLSFDKKEDSERQAYRALSTQFVESLRTGKVEKKDLVLASRVAAGQLSSSRLVSCLLHSFFDMKDREARGLHDRLASSRHLDSETVQEVAFSLGLETKTQTLMKAFGVNLKGHSKIDYVSEVVPRFFMAHRDPELLTDNVRVALELLQASNTRAHFLSLDETCWRPTYSLVSGLLEPNASTVVGGHFKPGDDWSLLDSVENLPEEKQSHLTLHFLLCRTDNIQASYCISMLPQPHKETGKALLILELTGQVLNAVLRANQLPPAGLAMDGGTSNVMVLKATLGLLPQADLNKAAFFCDCSYEDLPKLPFFPFRMLVHRKRQILGSLDCLHTLKRYACHHFSGTRVVHYGQAPMHPSHLLIGKIPMKAFIGTDGQSDREAQRGLGSRRLHAAGSTGKHSVGRVCKAEPPRQIPGRLCGILSPALVLVPCPEKLPGGLRREVAADPDYEEHVLCVRPRNDLDPQATSRHRAACAGAVLFREGV